MEHFLFVRATAFPTSCSVIENIMMKVDPESTVDLTMQYQLVRRQQAQGESSSKLEELVTQVKTPQPTKRSGFCSLLCGLFVCFGRRRFQVYDVNPPTASCLLPPLSVVNQGKKTLVLDLDETLVHSTFEPTNNSDLVVRVNLEGGNYNVYVKVRPGLEEFLQEASSYYEVVIFTASMAKYADPVLDRIDRNGHIAHRLFREHCVMHNGAYVKDLARLGRDLVNVVIVDVRTRQNSPGSYLFHPENAVPIRSYFDGEEDRELEGLLPLLRDMSESEDVASFLSPYRRGLTERATVDLSQLSVRLDCNSPRAA